jgi:hypothetical protein
LWRVLTIVLQSAKQNFVRIYAKSGGKFWNESVKNCSAKCRECFCKNLYKIRWEVFEMNLKVLKTVLQNAESILVRIYTKFGIWNNKRILITVLQNAE